MGRRMCARIAVEPIALSSARTTKSYVAWRRSKTPSRGGATIALLSLLNVAFAVRQASGSMIRRTGRDWPGASTSDGGSKRSLSGEEFDSSQTSPGSSGGFSGATGAGTAVVHESA